MSALYDQTVFVKLVHTTCFKCHAHFCIDQDFNNRCLRDRNNTGMYCPQCGTKQFYIGETEEQKLKRQLEAKQKELTWQEERSAKLGRSLQTQKNLTRAQKAAKTRALNRIKNGVCPCCNRTFDNLKWHMESKHPDFKPEDYDKTA